MTLYAMEQGQGFARGNKDMCTVLTGEKWWLGSSGVEGMGLEKGSGFSLIAPIWCVCGIVVASIQRNTQSNGLLHAIPLRKHCMSGAIEPTSHKGGWPGKLVVDPCEMHTPGPALNV